MIKVITILMMPLLLFFIKELPIIIKRVFTVIILVVSILCGYFILIPTLVDIASESSSPYFTRWAASMHYNGGGSLNRNCDKAFIIFKKSHELNDDIATLYLANMYLFGEGVEYNFNEAYNLYNEVVIPDNLQQYKLLAKKMIVIQKNAANGDSVAIKEFEKYKMKFRGCQ